MLESGKLESGTRDEGNNFIRGSFLFKFGFGWFGWFFVRLVYTQCLFLLFSSFSFFLFTWFCANLVLYFGLSFSFGLVIYIGVILFLSKRAMLLCTLSVLVTLFVPSPGSGMRSIDYFHLHLSVPVTYVRESK